MDTSTKHSLIVFLENLSIFAWGIFFLLFPLFFFTGTTDFYILPKQALLGIISLVTLLLLGVKAIIEKKVLIRRTPLDLSIMLLSIACILSAIFSLERFTSLGSVVPLLFAAIGYFVVTNLIRREQTILFLLATLITGAVLTSLVSMLTISRIYVFTFPFTRNATFSTTGSLLDQALYLAALLPICLSLASPLFKGKAQGKSLMFTAAALLLFAGIFFSIYQLIVQKVILLPFTTGFQIAFAAISQDTPRLAQGFFFGSGFGTFLTDFTRFKQAAFNANQNLWFLNFNQSSSFVLELLATTGILGLLSFCFVIVQYTFKGLRNFSNPLFISLGLLFIISFLLPFSFTLVTLLFFLAALFSSMEGLKNPEKSFDLEVSLVTLRKNMLGSETHINRNVSRVMPITFFVILLVIAATLGFFSTRYVLSDVVFNQSLQAVNNNNGVVAYQKQVAAINLYPRDVYYRIFSQTNFAIANSLVVLNNNKNASPTAQTQQTILNLIQQSITTAKTATTIAPLDVTNWQNLASVYRGLIGFGQNAESFAESSMQQAIALDPTNPQEFITLGGLYYQMGQYDKAIEAFQQAVNLKPDFANAYYNLGHAYEQKNDLPNALASYNAVKTLVQGNKDNSDKITSEITALQAKMSQSQGSTQTKTPQVKPSTSVQQPLNLSQPTTQLPQQSSQVQLPAPATGSAR